MSNIVIILASGTGTRFLSKTPKQFIKLAGKRVIEHTLDCFEQHTLIDEILVVTSESHKLLVEEIVLQNAYKKVRRILIGGETRQASTAAGIAAIVGDIHKVLVHDAVRPLLDHATIDRCLKALDTAECIDTVIHPADTIVEASFKNTISRIPDRSMLRLGQTPQGFRSGLLRQAHDLAKKDSTLKVTDDCGIVMYYDLAPVALVEGNVSNIKITHPSDIYLADRLFQLRTTATNLVDLNHLKNKVIVVLGASRGIGLSCSKIARQYGAVVIDASRQSGVDICDRASINRLFSETVQKYGHIDFIVNTAGVLRTGTLMTQTDDLINEQLDINLKGSILVAQEGFKYLKESGGSIALFTSSSYTRGRAFSAVYSATKAAVVNLTQGLAQEFHPYKVRINAINPERTATPMRTENFGNEPLETLLDAEIVARSTLATLLRSISGEVVDVRR
ncbi:2-C-methyl-D-erythritol 4-phosphate cytidylyltransferase [Acinetobacter towneri]|uniref:2-C-methyl-D-erythritol 4-phosphate cytidylyltransferase n=1 Tax=Acinetobacter towneri TaxID=202956 RepID=UPI00037F52B6